MPITCTRLSSESILCVSFKTEFSSVVLLLLTLFGYPSPVRARCAGRGAHSALVSEVIGVGEDTGRSRRLLYQMRQWMRGHVMPDSVCEVT